MTIAEIGKLEQSERFRPYEELATESSKISVDDIAGAATDNEKESECGHQGVDSLFIEFIPIGKDKYLPLRKPLRTSYVDPLTLRLEDWEIEFKVDEDFRQLVIRKYLDLLAKASNGLLTEAEEIQWLNIIEYVDYKEYRAQYEQPRFVWAEVVNDDLAPAIKTFDGTLLHLLTDFESLGFGWLRKGDFISCRVIFSQDNCIEKITDIETLPKLLVEVASDLPNWLKFNEQQESQD